VEQVSKRNRDPTAVRVFASHSPVHAFQMKRSRCPVKSNTRGAGWSVETYQESDSDDGLGQQPRQRVKDLHPHAIVTATPSGTQLSVVNAFTQLGPLPKAAQKCFQFVDVPLSLKAKRARTGSVSKLIIPCLTFVVITFFT